MGKGAGGRQTTCVTRLTILGFSEIFRRQLYGFPQDSQLYGRSKEGVLAVWAELRSLGLDVTFLLDSLIDEKSAEDSGKVLSEHPSAVE